MVVHAGSISAAGYDPKRVVSDLVVAGQTVATIPLSLPENCRPYGDQEKGGHCPAPLPVWTSRNDPMDGHAKSKSATCTELRIAVTGETLRIPVLQSTTVAEVKEALGARLGLDPGAFTFVVKQGCSHKQQLNHEEIARKVTIKGITSFKRQPMQHDHPVVIIGTGHLGIKQGMFFMKENYTNFVMFDRHSTVGGMAWHDQANPTSKLQTEWGVYHLEFDSGDQPFPQEFTTPWPSRDLILEHMQRIARDWGLTPHLRMNTDVREIKVLGKNPRPYKDRLYDFSILDLEGTDVKRDQSYESEKEPETFRASGICFYPGNLAVPRKQEYQGEDNFGGDIVYGMHGNFDYAKCTGKPVAIIGHGAFAVENVRTCCEFSSDQIYMVCRRRNMSVPRVASWMCNATATPLPAAQLLTAMNPMYQLAGLDAWSFYAVKASADRSKVYLDQKVRFGIGDIYFLTIYWGKLEVIIDHVAKLSKGTMHLKAHGRKLAVQVILKLLGFVGNTANDDLMKVKELTGFHINDDPKRWMVAEPISVQAANFSGTSFSPFALTTAGMGRHFMFFPDDYYLAKEHLPRNTANFDDPGTVRPAYVIDARHGNAALMTYGGTIPMLQELSATEATVKPYRQIRAHPTAKYLQQCKEDWDFYCQRFRDEGNMKAWPEYPYTIESVEALWDMHEPDKEYRKELSKSIEL